jgi:hypothetical protein
MSTRSERSHRLELREGASPDASRRSPAIRRSPRSPSGTTSPPTAPPRPVSTAWPRWPGARRRQVGPPRGARMTRGGAALAAFSCSSLTPTLLHGHGLARALAAELSKSRPLQRRSTPRSAWPKSRRVAGFDRWSGNDRSQKRETSLRPWPERTRPQECHARSPVGDEQQAGGQCCFSTKAVLSLVSQRRGLASPSA